MDSQSLKTMKGDLGKVEKKDIQRNETFLSRIRNFFSNKAMILVMWTSLVAPLSACSDNKKDDLETEKYYFFFKSSLRN